MHAHPLMVVTLILLPTLAAGCRELEHTPAPLSRHHVPLHYAFGGAVQTTFSIHDQRWNEIRALFDHAHDPQAERDALAPAIAAFERTAGEQTPTWRDHHRDHRAFAEPGQLDCVDESTNTTTYLDLLAQEQLLRFHAVRHPRWRFGFLIFDPHRTAVIRDLTTNTDYAVDSWPGDHAEPPLIQEFAAWSRKERPTSHPTEPRP